MNPSTQLRALEGEIAEINAQPLPVSTNRKNTKRKAAVCDVLLTIAKDLEKNCIHLRGALSRETLTQDSYGVHGSDFYTCPFCNAESGAGVLNKGVPHEPDCILHGESDPCESIIAMAQERDELRHDKEALRTENATLKRRLDEAMNVLEVAPHERGCPYVHPILRSELQDCAGVCECTCWKSRINRD